MNQCFFNSGVLLGLAPVCGNHPDSYSAFQAISHRNLDLDHAGIDTSLSYLYGVPCTLYSVVCFYRHPDARGR